MSEHSQTSWNDALARLHYGATCNERRWHGIPDRADKDRDVLAVIHNEMVEALMEANLQIRYLHEKFTETGSGNATLAKIRSALSQASQTMGGE